MDKNNKSKKRYLKYMAIGMVTGIVNGLFGSGGGSVAVPAMTLLLGAEEHKAHASAIAIILPLTVVSAFFYISNGFIDWNITWKVILGGMIGGYIGAGLLKKCPANVLRKIFALFMIIAALRMIF